MPGETLTDATDIALAWGRITHLLLEILPTTTPDIRTVTAQGLALNHPDAGLIPNMDDLINEALALVENPALDWLFSDGLAEVPVSATLPTLGEDRIYGIIDRLIITDDDVIAVDFKSNRVTPRTPDDTPEGVMRQMAAYRDALCQIYPNHTIRSLILWTRTGDITELDNATLSAALAHVTTT